MIALFYVFLSEIMLNYARELTYGSISSPILKPAELILSLFDYGLNLLYPTNV